MTEYAYRYAEQPARRPPAYEPSVRWAVDDVVWQLKGSYTGTPRVRSQTPTAIDTRLVTTYECAEWTADAIRMGIVHSGRVHPIPLDADATLARTTHGADAWRVVYDTQHHRAPFSESTVQRIEVL